MKINFVLDGKNYETDLAEALDISIPVRFDGQGLTSFHAPQASAAPFTMGDFTGNMAKGGSCNCDILNFSPHLHGTHTESAGHITKNSAPVNNVPGLIPAALVSVTPVPAPQCGETYAYPMQKDDAVITKKSLEKALPAKALIIRTLPNPPAKKTGDYGRAMPTFLSNDAMTYITACGIEHLLIDTPSVDRLDDGGTLSNHHIYWQDNPDKTVTELIYVPDDIKDGLYMMSLQVAPIVSDAAPSRPLLYRMRPL